ncbi:MAG: hypothetical protein K0S14_36 [Thermomicrobiales bacterium]|nr:hypothetical protein [Thermomicrobiales bacterium]
MNEADKELQETLENEQYHGEQIEAFLNNETVMGCFQALELSYYTAWKKSCDPAERDTLHAKASVIDELKETLRRVAASGERATHDLKAMKRATDQI